jgi:hypothetical protein
VPGEPLAEHATVLEAVQAGIAAQLAVLDDASLTGTGQSLAAVLGISGEVVAATLTSHLVREIVVRGSRGGPLVPLADQLNHDVTHLQGQRMEGMLLRLSQEVRQAMAGPGANQTVPMDRQRPPIYRADPPSQIPRPIQLAGHVFISYVRKDSARVDRLQGLLEDADVKVWRDTADTATPACCCDYYRLES